MNDEDVRQIGPNNDWDGDLPAGLPRAVNPEQTSNSHYDSDVDLRYCSSLSEMTTSVSSPFSIWSQDSLWRS